MIERHDAHTAQVGDLPVRRALPVRRRRMVGPWCFADHLGPVELTADAGGVGPHPHIGLATVTWLLDGELLHRDSLGSEQTIRPGQLNLMTAGDGVQHAEERTGRAGLFEGIQLWLALPDTTRHGPAAFEHHPALPQVALGAGAASVLVGELAGAVTPARTDWPTLAAELVVRGRCALALRPGFEHALVVLHGTVIVEGTPCEPGALVHLGSGLDGLELDRSGPDRDATVMLLGGEPFAAPVTMFWNFVGRDRAELVRAASDWNAGHERFGRVASPLPRIPAPPAPW